MPLSTSRSRSPATADSSQISKISRRSSLMDDSTASTACEDLKFFEKRLTEVISYMGPKCVRWRMILLVVTLCFLLAAYSWIGDETIQSATLYESLNTHPVFSACIPLLLFFLSVMGIHHRVVAPSIIARRCRDALSFFSLSCDDNGKLILKPAMKLPSP